MTRIPVSPALLRWAIQRAAATAEGLARKFPKLDLWLAGDARPTARQLDEFARTLHVPVGYLLLPAPPDEPLPIPDFRTMRGQAVTRPSPNLLDTIYACQERQGWFREFAQITRQRPVAFIGRATPAQPPAAVAEDIRTTLDIDLDERRSCATWEEALRLFVRQADRAGVMVMISGIVASNTSRALDPKEFRGFALADPLAPLIFVNGADSKAAQMFTLAHELAHLWLGSTALSDLSAAPPTGHRPDEVWCNAVAAETLVPLAVLRRELQADEALADTLRRLARRFKVSSLVILRRLLDAGHLSRARFDLAWREESERLRGMTARNTEGGDFYRTTLSRVSRRFLGAVVESTLEGQTLYRDAFRMLGIAKTETFNRLARETGALG